MHAWDAADGYVLLATLLVAAHFAFVLFVILGGWLLVRWPRLAWVHAPAVIWAALVEFTGWICPLTPWENRLRELADRAPYYGDFLWHYLVPLLYPEALTRPIQWLLGSVVLLVNAAAYWRFLRR
jgi:hypothetical protein